MTRRRARSQPRRRTKAGANAGAGTDSNPWSDVVVAVIRDGERVLVTRRDDDAHLGGFDEFPGGHRTPDESLEAACVREAREEVGLPIRVVRLLSVAWHEDAARRLALTFFECTCEGATTLADEVVARRGARWVTTSELAGLRFPPANRDVVQRLIAP